MEEDQNVSMLLDLFSHCLRLRMNCAKSAFVGFGLSHEEIESSQGLGTRKETTWACH